MMEAVFAQQFKKHMLPILKKIQSASHMTSEAIRAVDSKIESAPKMDQPYGLSETVMPTIQLPKMTSRIDEVSTEELRSEISRKYLSDMYQ